MGDVDLGALLEPYKSTLKDMSQSLSRGDHAKFAENAAGLVGALATGNPHVALLAPFARNVVAKAFGNAANEMFRRELAAMESEEDRQQLVARIAEGVEGMIGQALIQLVRVQHNVKEEMLEALGGARADLAAFREQFAAGLGGEAVRLDRQLVESGGIGVRVRATTMKRVWIADQTVRGAGSVGIDLE